jgi:hypothetical protein
MTQNQAPRPDEDWGSATPWNQPTPAPAAQQPAWPGPSGPARPPNVQTYMIPAVLVTLFCFLPTGIAAIIFASQVTAKLNSGDLAGAQKASTNARTWVIVSAVAGVIILGIVMLASLMSASSSDF